MKLCVLKNFQISLHFTIWGRFQAGRPSENYTQMTGKWHIPDMCARCRKYVWMWMDGCVVAQSLKNENRWTAFHNDAHLQRGCHHGAGGTNPRHEPVEGTRDTLIPINWGRLGSLRKHHLCSNKHAAVVWRGESLWSVGVERGGTHAGKLGFSSQSLATLRLDCEDCAETLKIKKLGLPGT